MRLIDVDELKKDLKDNYIYFGETQLLDDFFKALDEQPTVQAVPIEVLQEIRQEIKDLNEYQFQRYGIDRYLNAYEVKAIIDKHIKEVE